MTLHLTSEQHELLLKKIHKDRVSTRDNMAYVEAHDDKAHLIRIFGFGNFDSEVIEQTLLFEEQVMTSNNKPAWYVAYRSVVKLTVWDQCGCSATYAEGHIGESTHPRRGEAHGNAVTNSESYALKRSCVFLGDQYGLSLYNKGQRDAIVRWTLVKPEKPEDDDGDKTNTDDIPAVHPESESSDPQPDPRVTNAPSAAPTSPSGAEGEGSAAAPPAPAAAAEPTSEALEAAERRRQARADELRGQMQHVVENGPPAGQTINKYLAHLTGVAMKEKLHTVPVESLISPNRVPLRLFIEECLKAATARPAADRRAG